MVHVRNKTAKFAYIARIRKFTEVQELRNKNVRIKYAKTVALQLVLHRLLVTQLLLPPHLWHLRGLKEISYSHQHPPEGQGDEEISIKC